MLYCQEVSLNDPFGNERGSIDLRIFGGPQFVAATRKLKAHRKAYGADTEGMTGKAGHVPHFFENWNVYEMVDVEREGKDGSIEMVKEPAGIVGRLRSLSQATDFANALDPQKEYTIKPKAFRLPDVYKNHVGSRRGEVKATSNSCLCQR